MFKLSSSARKFLDLNKDKKVVFTNGCFDILHVGHLYYLNEAKALGDVLFMGLNADESIRRLKGEKRPICNEEDRKFFLENLNAVDFVEIFFEDTPYELITAVRPDILVKGGDWKKEDIVGSDVVLKNGGTVKSLSFKNGYSTTSLIEKIKDST
ncbi:MAG: D-glycero-beta-D-manno-heptose 1-phosphate adenylyltransferase [Bacteriovoracaceae bacterium]|nr:D-glycero-beta-D-manno-heptose 1-phosphate adenylyltransferase [Bacteriovoracaceae bacterium]